MVHFSLQILLHDNGEVPEMKDQGFAATPGTHTLVGIKKIKVLSNFMNLVNLGFSQWKV